MYCSRCGAGNKAETTVCIVCGMSLHLMYTAPMPMDDAVATFIGPNAHKYMRVWVNSKSPRRAVRIHWPALVITPVWLAYRRMYATLCIWAALTLLASVMLPRFGALLVFVLLALLCGLFGYSLYYRYVSRHAGVEVGSDESSASGGSTSLLAALMTAALPLFMILSLLSWNTTAWLLSRIH